MTAALFIHGNMRPAWIIIALYATVAQAQCPMLPPNNRTEYRVKHPMLVHRIKLTDEAGIRVSLLRVMETMDVADLIIMVYSLY